MTSTRVDGSPATLGRVTEPKVAAMTGRSKVKLPAEPRRILVADDEHLVASGVCANLKDLGYEVVGPAADGDEAVELCRTDAPDIALLDIRMPRTDGLTAAETIFKRLGVPVVMFSAYCEQEYVDQSNRVGVFGYLLKPVTQEQLRVGVSVAWGRYLDFAAQHSEIAALQQRLEDRKIIEQAKWVIVDRKGVTEPDAMRLLQRQARNNRRTLADIARSVIENEALIGAD